MPEPVKPAAGEPVVEQPKAPELDPFGSPIKPPEPPKPAPTPEEQKKADDAAAAAKAADIEQNPLVVELRKQLKDTKEGLGNNLAGQGKKIKSLEKQLDQALKGGKIKPADGKPVELPYKTIVHSKDLTQAQRDEMTDTEIKQMDAIADLQQKENERFTKEAERAAAGEEDKGKKDGEEDEDEEDEEEGDDDKIKDVKKTVKTIALELAGNDVDIANQIIESAKQFNLTGLTMEQLKERIASAHKLIPDYKPPQEQKKINGKTVKPATDKDDPFGNQKIIDEATSAPKGGYPL